MLCNLFEDTRVKCDRYWPEVVYQSNKENDEINNINSTVKNNTIINTCDYEIYLTSEEYKQKEQIIERKIKIINKKTMEEHNCTQLHIICWPDHSVPNSEIYYSLINTVLTEIDYYKYNLESKEPIVVHCSAGIGRTGTLISLYNLYDQINRQIRIIKKEREKDANYSCKIYFSIFNQVRKLREQRYMSVTDGCQYNMIYSYLYEYIKILTNNIINNNDKNIITIEDKFKELSLNKKYKDLDTEYNKTTHEGNNFNNDGNNINIDN